MRTAYENGYNVITLTDCCATLSEKEHQNALDSDFPMFSKPMTHEAFISLLAQEAAPRWEVAGH